MSTFQLPYLIISIAVMVIVYAFILAFLRSASIQEEEKRIYKGNGLNIKKPGGKMFQKKVSLKKMFDMAEHRKRFIRLKPRPFKALVFMRTAEEQLENKNIRFVMD